MEIKEELINTIVGLLGMIEACPYDYSFNDNPEMLDRFLAFDIQRNCEFNCGHIENCGKNNYKCWNEFFNVKVTKDDGEND